MGGLEDDEVAMEAEDTVATERVKPGWNALWREAVEPAKAPCPTEGDELAADENDGWGECEYGRTLPCA